METIGRNDACWCGSGKKYKKCHCQFDEKLKELQQEGHIIPSHDMIKTPEQIEKIKESGKINIAVLDYVAEHIKAGVTTQQIDDWVYEQTTSRGAIPAPLNYEGFPKSVCTSSKMIKYVTEFLQKMSFYKKVISSTSMFLRSIMDISQILLVCSVLVKFLKKRKN